MENSAVRGRETRDYKLEARPVALCNPLRFQVKTRIHKCQLAGVLNADFRNGLSHRDPKRGWSVGGVFELTQRKPLEIMVGTSGFEPLTSTVSNVR